jgi:hypothetical protein
MMWARIAAWGVAAAAVGLVGCQGERRAEPTDAVVQATHYIHLAEYQTSLLLAVAKAADGARDGSHAAELVAANLALMPEGCAVASAHRETVQIDMHGCDSGYDPLATAGFYEGAQAEVTLAKDGDALSLDLVWTSQTGDTTLSFSQRADWLVAAGVLSVQDDGWTLSSGWTGTGIALPPGSYDVATNRDDECIGIDGQWQVDVGVYGPEGLSANDYRRCPGACPTSGQLVYQSAIYGMHVTIDFDGSDSLRWQTPNGESGIYPSCQ